MFRWCRQAAMVLAAVLVLSTGIFADEKTETDSISFAQGTDDALEVSAKDIKIKNNASFSREEVSRCRNVLGRIMAGKTQGLSMREFTGMEPVVVSDPITLCRDGKYLYCVIDPEPGMNQLNGYELVSADKGRTWEMNAFHRVQEQGDTYFFDGNLIYIDGIDMESISVPNFSADLGKSYKQPNYAPIKKIMSLPALNGYCTAYARIRYIDREDKKVALDWYMKNPETREDEVCFYSMTVSYPSMKVLEQTDRSGLLKEAGQYLKSTYLFEQSGSAKPDRTAIRARFLHEYRLAGAGRTAAEIRLAINEIYARKGYDFKELEYADYFAKMKWYKPVSEKKVTEADMNENEKAYVNFLVGLEKEYLAAVIK
ncbi:MAG: YARHG domain-containing protein [Sarcina sp.]|nr:YARHG domain-containing protein [Sarcina sp.]